MCIAAAEAGIPQFSDVARVPVVRAGELSEPFEALEKAVEAALREASPLTLKSRNEYGGMVLRGEDGFRYTRPVTSDDPHSVRYSLTIPKGQKPAAMYHTHPCGPQSVQFSRDDIAMLRQLKVPSFIGEMCSQTTHVLNPDTQAKNPTRGTPVPSITFKGGTR